VKRLTEEKESKASKKATETTEKSEDKPCEPIIHNVRYDTRVSPADVKIVLRHVVGVAEISKKMKQIEQSERTAEQEEKK
jgi:hypothetical protein